MIQWKEHFRWICRLRVKLLIFGVLTNKLLIILLILIQYFLEEFLIDLTCESLTHYEEYL